MNLFIGEKKNTCISYLLLLYLFHLYLSLYLCDKYAFGLDVQLPLIRKGDNVCCTTKELVLEFN